MVPRSAVRECVLGVFVGGWGVSGLLTQHKLVARVVHHEPVKRLVDFLLLRLVQDTSLFYAGTVRKCRLVPARYQCVHERSSRGGSMLRAALGAHHKGTSPTVSSLCYLHIVTRILYQKPSIWGAEVLCKAAVRFVRGVCGRRLLA